MAARCNMSTFTSDGNARMQTVLREFVCVSSFLGGKRLENLNSLKHKKVGSYVFKDVRVLLLKEIRNSSGVEVSHPLKLYLLHCNFR